MGGAVASIGKTNTPPIMEPTTATALTLTDIVFANRNRAYGAFVLRQNYQPTLSRALVLGVGLFLLAVSAPSLYARFHPANTATDAVMRALILENLPAKTETTPVVPPAEPTPAMIKNLPPVVLTDAEVETETPPPPVETFEQATSGAVTQAGVADALAEIQAPETTAPSVQERAVEVQPTDDSDFFIMVEQQPEFPGGMSAMQQFLGRSLHYPTGAAQAGVSGKVFVSFIVGTDGRITDVAVLKGIGFGCDEEAVRVVRAMPVWKPGKQSGRAVRVKYNLPISFALE
jgi:periplasmic protein TonB